jgi:hypothetical protein
MLDCSAYRELNDTLGLTAMAGEMLADARTGKNGRHALIGLLRQSVFGRLAEDVNDAERLRHYPAMRWVGGGKAAHGCAVSPSQMGGFETHWLARHLPISLLLPTCLASGSTSCTGADRRGACARHGFEREPDAATWNIVRCVPAMYTAPTAAMVRSSRSLCVIRARSHASISGRTKPTPCQSPMSIWRRSGSNTLSGYPPTKFCSKGSAICASAPVRRPPNEVRRFHANFTHQAGS